MCPCAERCDILSIALITAGLVILADVAVTLAWKEPVSTIYSSIRQGRAADELERLERAFPSRRRPAGPRADAGRDAQGAACWPTDSPTSSRGPARASGASRSRDRSRRRARRGHRRRQPAAKGPGHYPETPCRASGARSGSPGTGRPIWPRSGDIDQLDPGDEIVIEMPYASFSYEVEKSEIVEPSDVEIVRDVGRERLVLTACHPLVQRRAAHRRVRRRSRMSSLFAGGARRWLDP